MKRDAKPAAGPTAAGASPMNMDLQQYIEDNAAVLLGILCSYVAKSGLARDENVSDEARELLGDVITEAFKSLGRFDRQRPVRPWLLGIAANLILRRQRSLQRKGQREVAIAEQPGGMTDGMSKEARSDAELFDRIASKMLSGKIKPSAKTQWAKTYVEAVLQQELEDAEQAEALLARVPPADQEVLRLAYIHELEGEALAKALDIKPSTARSRLHRAIKRLRKSLEGIGINQGGEK